MALVKSKFSSEPPLLQQDSSGTLILLRHIKTWLQDELIMASKQVTLMPPEAIFQKYFASIAGLDLTIIASISHCALSCTDL